MLLTGPSKETPCNASPSPALRRRGRLGHWLLTLFVAFVFIQSPFFKFTDSPETVYIFQGEPDPWVSSLGFPSVFAPVCCTTTR